MEAILSVFHLKAQASSSATESHEPSERDTVLSCLGDVEWKMELSKDGGIVKFSLCQR